MKEISLHREREGGGRGREGEGGGRGLDNHSNMSLLKKCSCTQTDRPVVIYCEKRQVKTRSYRQTDEVYKEYLSRW